MITKFHDEEYALEGVKSFPKVFPMNKKIFSWRSRKGIGILLGIDLNFQERSGRKNSHQILCFRQM
jgi:hypothetical protein